MALLFLVVGAPAEGARAGEDGAEGRAWKAQRVEQERREELDVGAERPPGMALGEQRVRLVLDGAGEREFFRKLRVLTGERLDGACQRLGARIAHPIYTVAHAHDTPALSELGCEPAARSLGTANGVEHVEHGPRRAAVQWPAERAECCEYGGDEVRTRGGHHARRERGGVQSVIAHRQEVVVERPRLGCGRRLAAGQPKQVVRVTRGSIGSEPALSPRLAHPVSCRHAEQTEYFERLLNQRRELRVGRRAELVAGERPGERPKRITRAEQLRACPEPAVSTLSGGTQRGPQRVPIDRWVSLLVEQQDAQVFEIVLAGEGLEGLTCYQELAALAIHMAETRVGGDDPFEARGDGRGR